MKARLITGLSAAAILLGLLFYAPVEFFQTFVLACATWAYVEYDRLFFPKRDLIRQILMAVLLIITLLSMKQSFEAAAVAFSLSIVFLSLFHVLRTGRDEDSAGNVHDLSLLLMGYFYITNLAGFVLPIIETGSEGKKFALLLFLLVFMGDTAAYLIGTRWGKHRLAPGISPKKSIEGALGAVLVAVFTAWCWVKIAEPESSSAFLMKVLFLAPPVSVLAQMGDLFESMLKRSQAQKDSGSFLPGHGGMLDRVDGLFMSSGVFYFYLIYVLGDFL